MKIRLNRDSVHPGDDIYSHEKLIEVSESTTLHEFLSSFKSYYPLPGIWGGQATWILKGNKILAILAQQWKEPKYFVLRDTPISEFIDQNAKLHFLYWVQDDPDSVFDEIFDTGALPVTQGGYRVKPENGG